MLDNDWQIISILFDGHWAASDAHLVLSKNLPMATTWYAKPYWNLGTVLPWTDEKLMLHLSFNGGNVRRSFWNEWIYPDLDRFIGSIFFIDANRPFTFPEAKALLRYNYCPNRYNPVFTAPTIVAVANSDKATAWDIADIQLYLRDEVATEFRTYNPADFDSVKELLIYALTYFAMQL